MSYLDKQISLILEMEDIILPAMGGAVIGGAIGGYLKYKSMRKTMCFEPNWSEYVSQMKSYIRQLEERGNTRVANNMKNSLRESMEHCKKIREEHKDGVRK